MNHVAVVSRLRNLETRLRAHGIEALYLYGSYARDEGRPESDLDILADFAPGRAPDFTRFMGAYHALEEAFPGAEIGFGTRDSLVPAYRAHIEDSAVRVF